MWSEPYRNLGLEIFCPHLPDIESYYVTEDHVVKIYDKTDRVQIELAVAQAIDGAEKEMRVKFKEKRRQANLTFWRDGGGPATKDLWDDEAPMSEDFTLGKVLLPYINKRVREIAKPGKDLFKSPSSRLVGEISAFLKAM